MLASGGGTQIIRYRHIITPCLLLRGMQMTTAIVQKVQRREMVYTMESWFYGWMF